jgi:competence protein ComFC
MEILSIGQAIFDLFFPRRCLNCDSVISFDNPLCISCAANLPYTHWHLNKKNFAYEKLKKLCKIEAAHSLLLFQHDNVTQKLLHNLKYNNHPEIGILLAEKLSSELSLSQFDGIIPVPIHPKKLKKRGYNQVVPYAKTLAERNNIPIMEDVLIRIENNPSQIFKNRVNRLSSIKNAFDLTDKPLEGHILLMDDVLTTGATLSTCVKLIQSKYPEVKISVMTIACAQ